MGSGWLISDIYSEIQTSSFKRHGLLKIEDVARLALRNRDAELANHILIAGANGMGKSFTAMCLAKTLNPLFASDGKKRTLYATEKTSDYLKMMESNKNDIIVVDEANRYLGSRDWNNPVQIKLINQMEINRADRIIHIVCNRGYFSLTSRYRNEQASVIIWQADRAKGKNDEMMSYSYVFAAAPIFSGEERFALAPMKYCTNHEDQNRTALGIKSFCGYLMTPHINRYFTHEEIKNYQAKKAEGINKASTNNIAYVEKVEAREEGRDLDAERAAANEPKPFGEHKHTCGCITKKDGHSTIFINMCDKHKYRPDQKASLIQEHINAEKEHYKNEAERLKDKHIEE
jgi:hypothetical protein